MPNERASNTILRNNGLLGFVPRARPAVKLAGGRVGYVQSLGARGEIRRPVRQPTYVLGANGRARRGLSADTIPSGSVRTVDEVLDVGQYPISPDPIPLEIENFLNDLNCARTRDFLPIVFDGQNAIALSQSGAKKVQSGLNRLAKLNIFLGAAANVSDQTSAAYANLGDMQSAATFAAQRDVLLRQGMELSPIIGSLVSAFQGSIRRASVTYTPLGLDPVTGAAVGTWVFSVITFPVLVTALVVAGAGLAFYMLVLRQSPPAAIDIAKAAPVLVDTNTKQQEARLAHYDKLRSRGLPQKDMDKAMAEWDLVAHNNAKILADAARSGGVLTPPPSDLGSSIDTLGKVLKYGVYAAGGIGLLYVLGASFGALKYARGQSGGLFSAAFPEATERSAAMRFPSYTVPFDISKLRATSRDVRDAARMRARL